MTIVVVVVAMRKVCNNSVKIYFIMSLSAIWDPMQPVCPQMLLFSNPGVYEINDLLLFFGGGGGWVQTECIVGDSKKQESER